MADGSATGGLMTDVSMSAWRARLEELGDELGYFEPLGAHHSAFFSDDGPILLVSFETRAAIRDRDEDLPLGYEVARMAGHSSLTLIAEDASWFRDPAVYAYFDRLVDEAFFEDFDRVIFYGAGPGCAYAAAAFSVAAPGATLIALQPQATLDPRIAGWDDRFRVHRRLDFTDRYGFAPDMTEGLGSAFVIFDPTEPEDAMHAALFARSHVTLLPCPYAGGKIEELLIDIDILLPILQAACSGDLSAATFWRLYRARRNHRRYQWMLARECAERGRSYFEAIVCRDAIERLGGGPRFRSRLNALMPELEARGITLPALV